jgi:hypothetical protein
MSDEECRSFLASTAAGGGRLHEDFQAPAFGPSIELDMIDNLAQPIACNLMLLVRSYRMEIRRALVYPRQTMLNDIQIDTSSYAVVKVDMVHDNLKDLKLGVPLDDMTLTMRDTVARRAQWRWTTIDVDPAVVASVFTSPGLMSSVARLPPSPNLEQLILSPIRELLPPIIEKPQKSLIQYQQHPSPILELMQKSPLEEQPC